MLMHSMSAAAYTTSPLWACAHQLYRASLQAQAVRGTGALVQLPRMRQLQIAHITSGASCPCMFVFHALRLTGL